MNLMTRIKRRFRTRTLLQSTLTRNFRKSVVLVTLILPGVVFADWSFYPLLRVGADFDDNATLTSRTDDIDSISGFIGEASVGIAYQTPTNYFFIEPLVRVRRYDSDGNFDSDDQFLVFRMRHSGEFNTLSLRGGYSRESVRTAELADAALDTDIDPDEIEDDDTARVFLDQTREKFRIVPRWSYSTSKTSKIVADINYISVSYSEDNSQLLRLLPYTDIRGRLAYTKLISPRNTALVFATARNYQTDLIDGDFSGYGISAGIDRQLTETSTFRALIGAEVTDQLLGDSDPHMVADLSFVRTQETTRFLAQFRRLISASGTGFLSLRNEFNLRFTRDLTEKFSAGLGARAYETQTLSTSDDLRNYVQLHAQVLWRFSNAFSMQANYRHTVLDRAIIGESASSNRFTVWFSYHPNSGTPVQISP